MEGAEHRQKAKQNSPPPKPVVRDFHQQQEVQAELSLLVSSFQDIRRDGDRSLGYAQPWKNGTKKKSKSTWLLGAQNIRQQSEGAKAFKYYAQYPVMQGPQEGKRADLWGPWAQFGVNIPMNIGLEYQCLKGLC